MPKQIWRSQICNKAGRKSRDANTPQNSEIDVPKKGVLTAQAGSLPKFWAAAKLAAAATRMTEDFIFAIEQDGCAIK